MKKINNVVNCDMIFGEKETNFHPDLVRIVHGPSNSTFDMNKKHIKILNIWIRSVFTNRKVNATYDARRLILGNRTVLHVSFDFQRKVFRMWIIENFSIKAHALTSYAYGTPGGTPGRIKGKKRFALMKGSLELLEALHEMCNDILKAEIDISLTVPSF